MKKTSDLVYLKNEQAVCDSLQVAEKFGKRHNNVLRDISNLLKNEQVKRRKLFCISSYKDAKGENRPMYLMNRKGFTILVMGFNGKDALHWKLAYSDAFDKMEAFIREKQTKAWVETRQVGKLTRKAETDTIQRLVEYAKDQGSAHAEKLYLVYSKLANKMAGVQDRDKATVTQLNNLSMMENIILHIIDTGILNGKHYKAIYQDCKKRLEIIKDLAYLEVAG